MAMAVTQNHTRPMRKSKSAARRDTRPSIAERDFRAASFGMRPVAPVLGATALPWGLQHVKGNNPKFRRLLEPRAVIGKSRISHRLTSMMPSRSPRARPRIRQQIRIPRKSIWVRAAMRANEFGETRDNRAAQG